MATDDTSAEKAARSWATVGVASVLVTAVLVGIWLDAVPRSAVCPTIYPMPESCAPERRHDVGVAWTLVIATTYVLVVVVALTEGRRRRWFLRAGLVVLALVAWFGYRSVMGSTGYLISS